MPQSPFAFIKNLKTVLQAFAFVVAANTVIWLLFLKVRGSELNNRTFGILALSFLGFAALLLIGSFTKKDRPASLLLTLLIIGSLIVVVILAIQQTTVTTQPRAENVNGLNALNTLNDNEPSSSTPPVGPPVSSKPVQEQLRKRSMSSRPVESLTLAESKTNLEVGSNNAENAERIWIKPLAFSIPEEDGQSNRTVENPSPMELQKANCIAGIYRMADPTETHEFYIAGPWKVTVLDRQGIFETNNVRVLPPGAMVFRGTCYSVNYPLRCEVTIFVPSVSGGGSGSAGPPPEEIVTVGPHTELDREKSHSMFEFVEAYSYPRKETRTKIGK
jgi:hypothetical protein